MHATRPPDWRWSNIALRTVYDPISVSGPGISALLPHPTDGSVIILKSNGAFIRVRPETTDHLQVKSRGLLANEDQTGALSPDGSLMAATDTHYNVRLLDLETMEWIGADSHTLVGEDLRYAPNGRQFASLQPERIRLWDGRTGEYQASLPLPSLTARLSISYLPDSTGLIIAATDGRTWTVDTRTDRWAATSRTLNGSSSSLVSRTNGPARSGRLGPDASAGS